MSARRSTTLAALLALAMGAGSYQAPPDPVMQSPEAIQRKLTKAEKKRAKRQARNLQNTRPERK